MTSEQRREARYKRRKEKRVLKRSSMAKYNDFEWVFSYDHLYRSFKKSRRNVGWKASTQKYISQAPLRVYKTHEQLLSGKYKSSGFFEFDIMERGKPRHIRSVTIEERVVQRCLCDYCLVPLLTRGFIYDNGASIAKKGYHFTRARIVRFLKHHISKYGSDGYVLIFDFSKFFDNVSHDVCKEVLHKHVTDPRIIKLVEHFIDMFGDIGLGLGSQISQIFALASADKLDHMIKEKLRIKHYARYMDDGCLIHHSKEYLQYCLDEISKMCDELGIHLNKKKTQIIKLSKGFTWLKTIFYILPNGRIIRKITRLSVTKMRRKLVKFQNLIDRGKITIVDAYTSFQSWRAYAKKFNANFSVMAMEGLFKELFQITPSEAAQLQ